MSWVSWVSWVSWCAGRWRSWRSIINLLPVAGWPVTIAAVGNLLIGVLPIGFVIGTSVAMERIPAIGTLSGSGDVPVAAGLAVAALFLQSLLAPFQAAFTELISRRVDGVCARQLMRATLTDVPVAKLEQADVLDQLGDARRGLTEESITPGAAAAGLVTLIARYAQLAAAIVIVGVVLGPAGRPADRSGRPGRAVREPGFAVTLVGDRRAAGGRPAEDVLRLRHRQ